MLQAALNGARSRDEHPRVPRTPEELAREARAARDAGADVVHVHAYDGGRETLDADAVAATLRAIRAACPRLPISLTTSAEIEPDPARRLALVAAWTELPDLVTANQGEPGIVELCEHLLARGVAIEAGLLSVADARAFVASPIASRCIRVLAEPLDADAEQALAHAAEMERVLADAHIALEQVHHGEGIACWAVNRRGAERGHGIRTGLEDVVVLPDGRLARDNAELVSVARELLRETPERRSV
jgi:uncharacterized protein (DUF849 family)